MGNLGSTLPMTILMRQRGLSRRLMRPSRRLAANPGLGRLRKFRNPRLKGVRSWLVSGFDNYLIFYRAVPGGIEVLHVYHGARDIEALFGEKQAD